MINKFERSQYMVNKNEFQGFDSQPDENDLSMLVFNYDELSEAYDWLLENYSECRKLLGQEIRKEIVYRQKIKDLEDYSRRLKEQVERVRCAEFDRLCKRFKRMKDVKLIGVYHLTDEDQEELNKISQGNAQ
jgi:chemotaxis protein histidine kinase CheA